MEVKRGRMVHLGYGKYWRSDEIVGLSPIEEDRGPGRRTEVWVATREEPLVASRSEQAILRDMARLPGEAFRAEEARELLSDIADDLSDVTPVLRRMLANEVRVDVEGWIGRIRGFLGQDRAGADADQEDLFGEES